MPARQMSVSSKKHWTAATASQVYEKINRYTFLDRNSLLLDGNKRGKNVREITFADEHIGVYALRFSPDGNKLLVGYGTGGIEVIDVELGVAVYSVKPIKGPAYPIMTIRCVGDQSNIFFAGGICGNIYLCKFRGDSSVLFAEEKNNEINAMDIDPNSGMLATGGKDGVLRLYDTTAGKIVSKLQNVNRNDDLNNFAFHTRRIFAIKFHSKRPNTFLSGGWDDCIKIWDTRNKEGCVRNIPGPHICGDALDVKENVVLSGQWTAEESLQLWDFGSGKLISTINPTNRVQTLDGEFLYCCQFLKGEGYSDAVVAGGSGTGYLNIVHAVEEKILCTFKVNKLVQALDNTSTYKVAYGGMETVTRIAQLAIPEGKP